MTKRQMKIGCPNRCAISIIRRLQKRMAHYVPLLPPPRPPYLSSSSLCLARCPPVASVSTPPLSRFWLLPPPRALSLLSCARLLLSWSAPGFLASTPVYIAGLFGSHVLFAGFSCSHTAAAFTKSGSRFFVFLGLLSPEFFVLDRPLFCFPFAGGTEIVPSEDVRM